MKAFFDAHPTVLETSIRLIRANLKDIRIDIIDGKSEAKKVSAPSLPAGALAADSSDADELLGGLEASAGDDADVTK
jgi:acyl carrier protein